LTSVVELILNPYICESTYKRNR